MIRARRAAAAAGVAALLAAPTIVQQTAVREWLQNIGVLHRPQRFVELSFENPTQLSAAVRPDGEVTLTFRITSRLAAAGDIPWTVRDDARPEVLAAGTNTLRPGQSTTTTRSVRVDCSRPSVVRVTATPPGAQAQSIDLIISSRPAEDAAGPTTRRLCGTL